MLSMEDQIIIITLVLINGSDRDSICIKEKHKFWPFMIIINH